MWLFGLLEAPVAGASINGDERKVTQARDRVFSRSAHGLTRGHYQ